MYVCAHKCMRPLQYSSNIVYEMTRSYGVCLYVSTIHVYTVRHYVRPKNRCVSANMPKKIRVDRTENLFIFLQIFIL